MNFFDKFNKLKNNYQDNKLVVISLLVELMGMMFLTFKVSSAYLTYQATGLETNYIKAGSLVLNLKNQTNMINMVNAVPQLDADALENNSEYSFKIANDGTLDTNYEIYLNNICVENTAMTINNEEIIPDKCIPLEHVKVGVKKDNGVYEIVSAVNNKITIDSGLLRHSTEGSTYTIKLWLDKDTPNDYNGIDENGNERNVYFIGEIEVYGEQLIE